MKVIVFGASGATGRQLVSQGLARGHAVTAFVRDPAKLPTRHDNLKIHQGDVADRNSVESAIRGQEAAISALGAPGILRRYPAATLGIHNILTALEQAAVPRFVYLSADIVREARQDLGFLGRYVAAAILHNVAADHELEESMIKQSRLDWIIVRPPRLTNGAATGVYRSGEHVKPASAIPIISRADLADFMLKQLTDETFVRKAPVVMY